jgi:hypothetical protein
VPIGNPLRSRRLDLRAIRDIRPYSDSLSSKRLRFFPGDFQSFRIARKQADQ